MDLPFRLATAPRVSLHLLNSYCFFPDARGIILNYIWMVSWSWLAQSMLERRHVFPNCLCGISTRQLELLLWKTRPDSQTYPQDCSIFFIQLNNVNKLKKGVPTLCEFPSHKVAHYKESHSLLFNETIWENIEKMLGCQALLPRAIFLNV